MSTNSDEQRQRRKSRAERGTRSQKMMSFRLDADVQDYLSTKPNKGRFINDLIRAAANR